MTLWHRGSIFHANKKRFKLDIHARLIGDRITRVQPLFFDSAQLRAGKGRERPATRVVVMLSNGTTAWMLASRSCPSVLKL